MKSEYVKDFYRRGKYEGWVLWDWRNCGFGLLFRLSGAQEFTLRILFFELHISFYGK